MLNMGLPKDAVKNALARDGKDPTIMDLDVNKSLKSQLGGNDEPKDAGPPLKDDPVGLVLDEFCLVMRWKILNVAMKPV